MAQTARPGMAALWWSGTSGGLFGGSVVGISEALYVLTSTTPSEYQALPYGAVLYGIIGILMGAGIGVGAALAGRFARISAAFAWCAGFFGVVTALGVFILRYIINKTVYVEQGVPMPVTLEILGGLVVVSLIGLWVGGMILSKTPLRVLTGAKGTAVGWLLIAGLCFLFSLMPAPGVIGNKAPHRPQPADLAAKPNVLLIHIDALRADALSPYGAPEGASPNFEAFAKDAVVFEQNITQASWTRASTASMFTSLPPGSHNCETKDAALSPMVDTVAEIMQKGGYATGGLPNNANVTGALGFGQGYDYYPYTPEYPLGAAESSYALSMYAAARKLWTHFDTSKHVEQYYMPAETQFARAEDFISAQGKDRWFLYLHLMEPHDPYFRHPYDGYAYGRAEFPNPPKEKKDELRALYAGEVKHADEEFGKFVAELKKQGVYDDMLLIVTADHGEEFLEHGGWWHGDTLYDEQIHVPLMVKLPKQARAGTRVPWQVREIDIAPTIADVAKVEASSHWRGQTLFADDFDRMLALDSPPPAEPAAPVADGAAPADAPAAAPAVAWVAPTWANHPGSREALSQQDFEGYKLQSLRAQGSKIIEALRVPVGNDRNQPPVACYDLQKDAGEQQNLAGTGCESSLKPWLDNKVADAANEAVGSITAAVSDADKARLEALGYIQSDVATEPAKDAAGGGK